MEAAIKLAAHLYEARDSVRTFWGDEYEQKIAEWRDLVRLAVSKTVGHDKLMPVAYEMCRRAADGGHGDCIPFICAAAVDIAEGK